MSYILDALRRAEAERQRGAVPGLHAQPVAGTRPDGGPRRPDSAHRRWRPGAVAMAGLLLTGLLAAAAGLGWMLKPSPAVVAVVAPALALPNALPVVLPVEASVVPPVSLSPAGPAVLAAPAVEPAPPGIGPVAGSAVGPAPTTPATDPAAASTRSPVAAAATVPAAAPATVSAVPAPVAAGPAATPTRLPTLAELPEALRREVQPLNLGGSVYADQAPLRIVIVNGQVFHEGDKPLPALQVQQIGLKSVVFSVRGQRFEMPL
jgi:general secretion pathway protein B